MSKGPSRQGEPSAWLFWGPLGLFLATGAAARVWGIFNELSLDEVWSVRDVLGLASPLGIFTSLAHDNNHPLNSLFIWLLGEQARTWVYRLPALAAGAATPWLMYLFARRFGRREALGALFLASLSFLLIEYSSEARGYAPAVFLSFASFLLAERALETRSPRDHLLFWGAAALGILSHATYLFPLAGILAWAAFRARTLAGPPRLAAGRLLILLLPPILAVSLYLAWWKGVFIEGGPILRTGVVMSDLAALAAGLPLGWSGAWAVGAAAAGVILWETFATLRKDPPVGAFLLVSTVVAPAAMLLVTRPAFLYPRYFLVPFALALIPLGRSLARLAGRGRWGTGLALCLAALYAAGNLHQTSGLLQLGRGQFRAALEFIAARSGPGPITVISNQDFRNSLLIGFHSRGLGREFRYVTTQDRFAGIPAEWYIAHYLDPREPRNPDTCRVFGSPDRYRLLVTFPSQPPAGITWALYRRVAAPAPPAGAPPN